MQVRGTAQCSAAQRSAAWHGIAWHGRQRSGLPHMPQCVCLPCLGGRCCACIWAGHALHFFRALPAMRWLPQKMHARIVFLSCRAAAGSSWCLWATAASWCSGRGKGWYSEPRWVGAHAGWRRWAYWGTQKNNPCAAPVAPGSRSVQLTRGRGRLPWHRPRSAPPHHTNACPLRPGLGHGLGHGLLVVHAQKHAGSVTKHCAPCLPAGPPAPAAGPGAPVQHALPDGQPPLHAPVQPARGGAPVRGEGQAGHLACGAPVGRNCTTWERPCGGDRGPRPWQRWQPAARGALEGPRPA